jgi:hypothetical protein
MVLAMAVLWVLVVAVVMAFKKLQIVNSENNI